MIIRLPQIGQIDTENLPDNFDKVVELSFQRYTSETRKEYRYEDKLAYIDAMRKQFWHVRDARDAVNRLILDRQKWALENDEDGAEILSPEDFYNHDFMCECFSAGFLPLHGRYTGDRHEDSHVAQVLLRIIQVVVGYEI